MGRYRLLLSSVRYPCGLSLCSVGAARTDSGPSRAPLENLRSGAPTLGCREGGSAAHGAMELRAVVSYVLSAHARSSTAAVLDHAPARARHTGCIPLFAAALIRYGPGVWWSGWRL